MENVTANHFSLALLQAQGSIVEAWLLSPSKHTNQNSGIGWCA